MTLHWLRALLLCCCFVPAVGGAQELVCPQLGSDEALSLPEQADEAAHVTADQMEITQDGLSTMAGTVRLVKGGSRLEAEALAFDRSTQRVTLSAESLFRNRDLVVRSQRAELDLARETGTFHDTEFTLIDRSARGGADVIRLNADGKVDIEDVYYTTCAPGSRAWFLQASDIELDREEGLGRARHARLRFGYVPILYAPWFQFPIDNRRRTGVLFPTIGNSDNTGFDARVPLYLNLAPNYDAQLTPRYMSERGTQLGAESRYLLRDHTGQLAYEYLDEDEQTADRRSYFRLKHQGLLHSRLGVSARFGEVSDTHYFEDLGGELEAASTTHIERSAQLTYVAPSAYTIVGRVTDYQTISETARLQPDLEPYQRLPEIRIDALTRKERFGTRLGITGQYVNFARETPPEGQRLDLNPYLRFEYDRSAFYVGSRLDLRYTNWVVTDLETGLDSEPTRTVPLFSAEGGIRLERVTAGGELQTVEPKVYYLYVPFREQDHLTLFDTGEPDFDFVQLFSTNRFSGRDLIADANHVAFALTSRLLEPHEGTQRFLASIGQIWRFETPKVGVDQDFSTPEIGGTDFIGELDYRLPLGLAFATAGQWSPVRNEFVRGNAELRWRDGKRRADVAYRRREQLPLLPAPFTGVALEQIDVSAATPVFGPLSVLGRWRYSREEGRSLEAIGGLEYQTCCWAARAAWRRYQFGFDEDRGEPEYTTGVYLQLELKGLTRIGAGFDALLPSLD